MSERRVSINVVQVELMCNLCGGDMLFVSMSEGHQIQYTHGCVECGTQSIKLRKYPYIEGPEGSY